MTESETLAVFLVPIGGDQHELYCETPVDAAAIGGGATDHRTGWMRRLRDRFRGLLAEADEWQRKRDRGHVETSRGLWPFLMRKIAEAVAEQRLVWLLRTVENAELVHPDTLEPARALEIGRRALRLDFEKHRRWMVIDGLAFLAFVPFTLLPGPNVPAIYFSFRALGHFFSLRGARRGLKVVHWTTSPAPQLTAIDSASSLDAAARDARLREVADALGLERLPAFLERVRGR